MFTESLPFLLLGNVFYSLIRLEELLNSCFAYISVPDLSIIPFTIMKTMNQIPVTFLQEIASNSHLYSKCSLEVRWIENRR
jgi:hypothetical protein